MRRVAAVIVCASCAAAPVQTATPVAPACKLGDPIVALPVRRVDGYPVKRVVLDDAARLAKQAALEKLVPGWTILVAASGEPILIATLEPIGAYEPKISDERVARVREALLALGLIEPSTTVRADAMYVSVVDHREFTVQQLTDSQKHVRLQINRAEPAPTPKLPADAHELTDDELHASWGADWSTRQATVVIDVPGHPCDLVVGHEHACDGAGPETRIECPTLGELRLERKMIEGVDGFRHVALLSSDRAMSFGGMAWPSITAAVPVCIDVVTSETLDADRCR